MPSDSTTTTRASVGLSGANITTYPIPEGRIATASHRGTLPYFLRDNQGKWQDLVGATAQTQKLHSPPFVETYKAVHNGKIFISPYHGDEELDENLRVAKFLADKLGVKVYLLPRFDPKERIVSSLRTSHLPKGVIENKNPDYLIEGKIFDCKCMMDVNRGKSNKLQIRDVENRYRKAKRQAENIVIEVPTHIKRRNINKAIYRQLEQTSKDRIVYVKYGRKLMVYKKNRG